MSGLLTPGVRQSILDREVDGCADPATYEEQASCGAHEVRERVAGIVEAAENKIGGAKREYAEPHCDSEPAQEPQESFHAVNGSRIRVGAQI